MVKTLSSDEFEGRAPGTAGEDKTVAYLIERFKAAGLQPGNKGSWTQDVPSIIARVALGALLIHHGATKVFGGVSGMADHLASLGWPLATLQAYLAAYTEFLGGIFLVVGLFTRLSAAFNVGLFTIIQ